MYLQPVQKGVGGPDALNHCIPGDGDGDTAQERAGEVRPHQGLKREGLHSAARWQPPAPPPRTPSIP